MSHRLTIPADLAALIEKREQAERRAKGAGRDSSDRRGERGELSTGSPVQATQPIALGDVAVPPELLERRKDGARREA